MFEENIRAYSYRAGGIPSVIIQEEPLQHSPHSLSFEAPSVQFESENPEDYHGYTTLIGPQSDHEESCLYNQSDGSSYYHNQKSDEEEDFAVSEFYEDGQIEF